MKRSYEEVFLPIGKNLGLASHVFLSCFLRQYRETFLSWLYFKMHEINVEPRNTANEKKIDKMLVQCNWIIMVFRASGTKCLVAHTKSNLTVPIEYFSGLSIFWVNLGLKICQLQGKWSYIQAKWTWNSPPSQPPQEMKSLQQEMVISKSLTWQLLWIFNPTADETTKTQHLD